MGYKCHKWTGAELKLLRDNCYHKTNAELADMVNAMSRHPVPATAHGVQFKLKRMDITRPASFRRMGRMAQTQFKPGHKRGVKRVPGVVYRGKADKDGYKWFVVDPVSGRRKLAHRWLWEQKNGPVPEGMVVLMVNGKSDPKNTIIAKRGSIEHMGKAHVERAKPDARRKAWDTRKRKEAKRRYDTHVPYAFS